MAKTSISDVKEPPEQDLQEQEPQEQEPQGQMWKSTCHECSPKLLLFLSQVWFSSFLVILSVYMIVRQGPDSPPSALWVSVLTSTATLWLPSPQLQQHRPVSPK